MYLVAHNALCLCVVEDRNGEAAVVLGLTLEIDLAEVCERWVQWVRGGVVSGDVLIGGCEAPT
jgi:hypothetical protein